jgi:hypothetical protein
MQHDKMGECVIVLGNHASHAGIGDVAYSVYAHFSRHFRVRAQEAVAPGAFNIIIDEFTNPQFVEYLKETKRTHPGTKYAIVATEFYTPFRLALFGIEGTFNFFGSSTDWRSLGGLLAGQLSLGQRPRSYMHRRFLGFRAAIETADIVLSVHPEILTSLELLSQGPQKMRCPAANLYPTIDLEIRDRMQRLRTLPFGFALTGSLTAYRTETAARLRRAFTTAGYNAAVYKEIPFGPVEKLSLEAYPTETPEQLFNFNPPQQARWGFSSPMRLLRAALLGQIPVVTKMFGDHDIERIALLWEPTVEVAQRFWCDATLGRETLVERFVESVAAYNRAAEEKNKTLTKACIEAGVSSN